MFRRKPPDVKPDWLVKGLNRVYEKARDLQENYRVRFKAFDWEGIIDHAEMDGLVRIFDRVYVFDRCFSTTNVLEKDEYKNYLLGSVRQLRESFRKASFMVVDFHSGNGPSRICDILSGYAVKLMDFPTEYGGCPLLPLETINRFLRSTMAWLLMDVEWGDNNVNVLLLHCERGGWPVLAFMLAVLLLLYRKLYTRERKTLEMVYDIAPRRLLLALSSPLNPQPSHLRYLQYISRRDSGSDWSPMDKPFNLECLLLRMVPNFDGEGGCRPMVRVYGRDPSISANSGSKLLFSTPKTNQHIQHYRQEESTVVKLNICCHVQGDVVIECIHLDKDLKHGEMMFRFMFNTAFVRFNSLLLSREEIDVRWKAKDRFQKDFKVEVLEAQKSELINKAISDYQESTSRQAGGLIIDNSVGEIDLSNMLMDDRELMVLEELGSGGFGTVHHGTWRGIDVAVKRTKKSNIVDQQSGQDRLILESLREAGILSKLQHPNVVSLYGCVLDESSSTVAIVTELVSGGSLRNILNREDKYLDYCKRLTIAKGAASGMEYLHLKNIVHFDLKSDNLLVDLKDPSRPICKVSDFGLSKFKKKTLVSGGFRGTLPWMAPELFKRGNNKVSEKVDVYSFGIVMWEIITGEVPYDGMHEAEILGGMYDNTLRPRVPASCDPEWRELMEQCWTADPQQRPSFTQIASRLHWMLVASS